MTFVVENWLLILIALVSGGMLIAPVMVSDTECRMLKLVKTGSRFDREDLFAVPYLPIVPQMAQAL